MQSPNVHKALVQYELSGYHAEFSISILTLSLLRVTNTLFILTVSLLHQTLLLNKGSDHEIKQLLVIK